MFNNLLFQVIPKSEPTIYEYTKRENFSILLILTTSLQAIKGGRVEKTGGDRRI